VEETDAAVIAASLVDPARFGALFDRHASTLYRYLVRRLGPGEADAMLGDVFRIAFERRESYDQQQPLARPWLYGIATNLLAKHRRREARRLHAMARLATSGPPAIDEAEQVAAVVDAASAWQRVADAVTALPDGERDALLLHVWEGLSYQDVAAALGLPVGTVRSRLARARGRLRELTALGGEGPGDDSARSGRVGS
jgi:RNA polymerase sigma factor (sigma-70 family)